jgi:hypothetical protein
MPYEPQRTLSALGRAGAGGDRMTISSAIVQAQRLVTMAQAHLRSLLLTAVVEAHGDAR